MKAQLSDDQATPKLTQIFFAGAGTGMIGAYVTFVIRLPAGIEFSPQYCHHSDRIGEDPTAGPTHTYIHPPDAPTNRSAGRNQRTLPGDYGDWSPGYRLWFLLFRRKSAETPA